MRRHLSLALSTAAMILAALLVHSAYAAPRANITHVGIVRAEVITLLPTDGSGGSAKITLEDGALVARVSDATGAIVGEAVVVRLPRAGQD